MKERPILFSAPMVRAILEGKKTQTQRALRIQPIDVLPIKEDKAGVEWVGLMQREPEPKGTVFRCKYGQPGDRLWVRETFSAMGDKTQHAAPIFYRADRPDDTGGWTPSIHMPRWASRINLEITSIRVERLQDISQADAIAEGAPPSHPSIDRVSSEYGYADFSRSWYAQLWDSINGVGSWDANPWVWCVSFRRLP